MGLTGPTVEPESQFGRAKVDQTEIKEDGYQVSFDFVDVEGNRLRLTEEQVDCLDGDELQEFLSGMHDAQHCPFFVVVHDFVSVAIRLKLPHSIGDTFCMRTPQ